MGDEQFKEWFMDNIDVMASLNIFHYNAERAKEVRSLLTIIQPELNRLQSRIDELEKRIEKPEEQTTSRKRAWIAQVK